jgi:hypothetical protein
LKTRGYQALFLQTDAKIPTINGVLSTADIVFRTIEDLFEWTKTVDDKEKLVLATISGDLYTLRDRMLQDLLSGIGVIIDGGVDDIDVNKLQYIGKFIKG